MTNSLIMIGTATIKTKKEVKDKKSSASAGACHIREFPDIPQTDGRPRDTSMQPESN
jgi:hypothetical protein